MAVYAVFQPPDGDELPAHAERIAFVRDAFSWNAFLFGPFWLLRHRLWLALVIYVAVVAALSAAAIYWRISDDVSLILAVLLALLFGLEAPTLRRRSLQRRGWRDRGIVVADGLVAAERRFFDDWIADARAPLPTIVAQPRRPLSGSERDIIGLFPEPGGPR
jgi:hypothetical protein